MARLAAADALRHQRGPGQLLPDRGAHPLQLLQQGVTPEAFGTPLGVVSQLLLQAAYQAGLGFLGGWYGGYLRRRQTQISVDARRKR
jgi:hypothetical protein